MGKTRGVLEAVAALACVTGAISYEVRLASLQGAVPDQERVADVARQEIERARQGATPAAQWSHRIENRLAALEKVREELRAKTHEANYLRKDLDTVRAENDRLTSVLAPRVETAESLARKAQEELRRVGSLQQEHARSTENRIERLHADMRPDPATLSRELLRPTVQLSGGETVGAGTVVNSVRDPRTGEVDTFVLTAYHVVRNIYADFPNARRSGLDVVVYLEDGTRQTVKATLIGHERALDVAVLRIRGDEVFTNVAKVADTQTALDSGVWDPITAVGCPLGNDPVPTEGQIARTDATVQGTTYWLITAPTYYGNSGGGIYLSESRELCGVFSKIYTHGRGAPVAVPHLGLCTPIHSIRAWLDEEGLGEVLPQSPAALTPISAAPSK